MNHGWGGRHLAIIAVHMNPSPVTCTCQNESLFQKKYNLFLSLFPCCHRSTDRSCAILHLAGFFASCCFAHIVIFVLLFFLLFSFGEWDEVAVLFCNSLSF